MWIGATGAAGALGHTIIDPNGPPCGCGQRGCVEQYASATAVAKKYGKGSAKDCFEAAKKGAKDALAAVDWSVEGLSIGVANTIQVLYPDVVVLAGGMALAGDFLLDKVRQSVKRKVFDVFSDKVRIEASQIPGDDAGWLGAALWAARKFETREIREPTSAEA
jgi:glucokinase